MLTLRALGMLVYPPSLWFIQLHHSAYCKLCASATVLLPSHPSPAAASLRAASQNLAAAAALGPPRTAWRLTAAPAGRAAVPAAHQRCLGTGPAHSLGPGGARVLRA